MASLLRRTRRGAARALLGLAAPLAFFLAGCADTPPEYNPVEWGRSAARGVGSLFEGQAPGTEPPAAEGRPYPNLATVPRPPKVAPRAEREAELARLQADQDAAADFDRRLRDSGAFPVAPPPPPAVSEAPAAPTPAAAPSLAAPVPVPPAAPSPSAVAPSAVAPRAAAPAIAQAQPPVAAIVQRVGAVAFARDGAALSETGQRALGNAAALARANNGRVRLVPAQVARQAPAAEQLRARHDAILQALERAGLPRERVRLDDGAGRRVDVYDLYVEY